MKKPLLLSFIILLIGINVMAAGGPGLTDFSSPENTRNGVALMAAAPPPTITSNQSFSVLENSALGTDVGTVGASDVTTNPSWSISSNVNPDGDSDDAFNIDAATGQITVNDPTDLDYETNTSFVIEVSLSDDSGAATPVNVTINLTDVNEFIPVVNSAGPFTIDENTSNTTLIVKMTATDVDGSATFSGWTISSGNSSGAFAIDASSGELTVADSSALDYEITTSFTIGVKVSDGTKLSEEEAVTINLVDVNDVKPVIGIGQSFSIEENTADGESVGIPKVSDGDVTETIYKDWTISSSTLSGAFAINSSTGEITVANSTLLDRETVATVTLSLTVDDGANTSDPQDVTITLTDVNDVAPVVTASQSFTIDENTAAGTSLSPVLAATDGDVTSTTFSNWTISTNINPDGDANPAFAIDASTGQLSVNDADDLDYETNTSLTIGVKVSDSKNLSAEQNVTINLNNLNDEAPIITADQSFSIPENSAYDYSVGTVAVTDPDSPLPTTYHDWSIKSGNTNGAFSIDASTGEIKVANSSELDLETTTSFTLGLTVNDGDNTSSEETVTIHLTDVNDIDPVITSDQSFNVDEFIDNGTIVGTVEATDGDTTTTSFTSWTIKSGNTGDAFAIDGTTGEITVATSSALDIAVNPTFTLTLTVSDGVNTSAEETVTINLTDVNNQNPVVTSGQTFDVDENSAATTSVGTVAATDADSNTTFQDWTITSNVNGDGDANDAFAIDASTGEITVNDADDLDREANVSLIIQVTVSDGTNTSVAENVTINLNDLNDVDPVVDSGQSFSIAENRPNGTVVGTATAKDGDVSTTTFQNWAISSSTVDGAFAIDASTGQITVANSADLDRETVETITLSLTVEDGVNTSDPQDVTITLTDVNDVAPVITADQVFNVDEGSANGTVVGTVAVTDQDVTSTTFHDWTITGGNTDNAFGISASSGEITVTNSSALDFGVNPSFTLALTVNDGTNTSAVESVTINLNDVNDKAPVITADQTFTIDENSVNSTVVGTVAATDPDAGTTFQDWTIVSGNTDNAFAINSSTGEITVATSTALDKETTSSFTLSLTVSDGANTSAEQTVAITLNDLNDEVPVITADQTFSIDENSANGSSVGTVLATDGDVTATTFQNWTITDGNTNGAFTINGSTGEITVAKSTELDREVVTSYTLTVTVDDGVNTSDAKTLTVNVNDVNDVLPVITTSQSFTVDENSLVGIPVGTVLATDGDVTATTFGSWQIVTNVNEDGDMNNAFTINSGTGEITVNDAGDLDREIAESFTIGVTVSDGVNTSIPQDVVINLNDLNDEAPVITANQIFNVDENATESTVVGTVVATDIDVTATTFSSWTILSNVNPDGDGNQAFAIDSNTGQITVNDAGDLDRETNESLTVQLTVSDGSNTSNPVDVVINLNELNDVAPVVTADQSFTVYEQSAVGTTVGVLAATDGDVGATTFQDWSIATNVDVDGDGTDAFALDPSTGVITVLDPDDLNRELNASLTIQVTVGDGMNTSDMTDVIINLSDTNNQPPVVTAGQTFQLDENSNNGTLVGTVLATDSDVTATTFQDWIITAGNDAGTFVIDSSTGQISVANNTLLDREAIDSLVVSVTVSDGTNTSASEDVTIFLNDVNDVAPVVTANQSFAIEENSANDMVIGTLVATDGDVTATTFGSWQIVSNVNGDGDTNNAFTINTGTGEITVNDAGDLDREAAASFTIGVTVSDGVNTSTPQDVVINLNDLNDEAPVITANQILNVDENATESTVVGTVVATDIDVTATTFSSWTILSNVNPDGDENQAFAIDSITGQVSVNDAGDLDRETNESLTVQLTVSDGSNTSDPVEVVINLNELNDVAPVVTADQSFTIKEKSDVGTTVGTLAATDGDISSTTFQNWAIATNMDVDGDGTGAFALNADTGVLTVADSDDLDREQNASLTIRVAVGDGINTSDTTDVVINLSDTNNQPPVVTAGQTFPVDENATNGTEVGTVAATDADVTATTFRDWTIVGGNDAGTFAINDSTGVITVADSTLLDRESIESIVLSITVSDSINVSAPEDVTITLNDVNDVAPVVTADQSFTIEENSANDLVIGTLVATDGDVSATTFQNWSILTGNASGTFALDESTGALSVADSTALDRETTSSFTLGVVTGDGMNTSDTVDVSINLTDVNDVTPEVTADQSFNVDENSVAGTSIGTVLATDGDVTATTFTNWTISTGNDSMAFAIDSLSGVLSVNDPATLDREVLDSLVIGVFVSDGLDTSAVQNVTIHLNDVNDVLPVIAADSTFAIDENSPAGTIVGTASATDGDVTATTFSNWAIIDGNTGGAFVIDGSSGQITVAQSSALDREKIDTLKLSVTVSDGVNTSAPELVIVTLNDVNDILPVIAAGQSFTLPENTVAGTSVGTIEVADSDVTASTFNNWQISTNFDGNGDGNPAFAIDSLSGNLTVNDPGDLDFETVPDFNIAVTVDDSVNTSLPVEVALHLTDKNDNAPVIITMPYFTIQENSEIGTLVAQFEATDVDVTPANFTWHIVKNTDPDMDGAEALIINETNGNLYIRDKDDFDYEANDELKVRISVWDGINRSDYLEVIVGITNDTSDDVTTGLDDLALKEVKVYPNPAQSYFYIDGPVGETVQLIDMNGRLVKTALMESNIQRFDLSGTPKGIYLVQIQHKTVSKVIVR